MTLKKAEKNFLDQVFLDQNQYFFYSFFKFENCKTKMELTHSKFFY